jgi:hypothetical protein
MLSSEITEPDLHKPSTTALGVDVILEVHQDSGELPVHQDEPPLAVSRSDRDRLEGNHRGHVAWAPNQNIE